jgi:hypothetical protein
MFRKTLAARAARFTSTASAYLGYQAGPLLKNQFSERVGYNSQPWAGAFVDVVARESGLQLPSFVYTGTALAELARNGLIRSTPLPGDVVFFNFSSENSGSPFGMPHVGIVVDTREYHTTGRFLTVEGNVRPANPRYGQDTDGVHQRVRYDGDVIAYARVTNGSGLHPGKLLTKLIAKLSSMARLEAQAFEEAAREQKSVITAAIKPGLRNRQIETVQLALAMTVGLKSATPGTWDAATANAMARYQRRLGYVGTDAAGVANRATLLRLASDTGLFQVTD